MQDKRRADPAPGRLVTVATYNVHQCIGTDRRLDAERILDVLRELNADVIAVQELYWDPEAALDLLAHFAQELGYSAIPGPTLLRSDGHYGNALLARVPVREVKRIDLSVPGHEARGALDVMFDGIRPGLHVVATHLGLRPYERRRQMREVLKIVSADSTNVVALMGDLNEWFLWGRPLRWLHAHFGYMHSPATYPCPRPLFALDRIWVKPRTCLIHHGIHRSALSRLASDHYPLRAVIADAYHEHGPTQ